MQNEQKKKRERTCPVSVHLSRREAALVQAEAKASGISRSAWIRLAVLARLEGEAGSSSHDEIQQVGQAALLAAQLATEVLAHAQIMQMPSPTQSQQIEEKRRQLYTLHFSPIEPDQVPASPVSQSENGINEIQEAEL